MKSNPFAVVAIIILALGAMFPCRALAQDPPVPVGKLEASSLLVRAGTKPTLNWDITYPAVVKDIVKITPPGTCTPKVKVNMDVRVVGASVKVVWLNAWGIVTRWEWAQTQASVSINNSGYTEIFSNTQDKVKPGTIVYTKKVSANQPINFAGRYYFNGWSDQFTSNSGQNVVALVNGDMPPTTTPLYQQPTIEDFIKPYLDGQGRVKIGPKDVIYLMELTHTNKNDGGFDLQDLALLVTFQETN
ncbi:hypothetical protein OVA24_08095 [Luteolibacter sp. SL250]|uniref:hypothetical protein n=1 Tax=Luteolibacter sp. SL250 TaxID=2995170 RepID=UPI0022713779|nr:hypothetical protein [Luteolibacter sp. SL250]WAC21345.1 hypothetical protein OVA24_08095 [Luteolibacter sp. SL250]